MIDFGLCLKYWLDKLSGQWTRKTLPVYLSSELLKHSIEIISFKNSEREMARKSVILYGEGSVSLMIVHIRNFTKFTRLVATISVFRIRYKRNDIYTKRFRPMTLIQSNFLSWRNIPKQRCYLWHGKTKIKMTTVKKRYRLVCTDALVPILLIY